MKGARPGSELPAAIFVLKCEACGCESQLGVAGPDCAHIHRWHEDAAQRVAPVLARLLADDIVKGRRL